MQEKLLMFRNRFAKVFRHISKNAKRQGISCYRIYDHDLPEFPLRIELYEDKLCIAEYKRMHGMTDEEHDRWIKSCVHILNEITKISPHNIFLKLRQRKTGRSGQYRKIDEKKTEFIVHENGLKFIINLSDYLDTGFFLDHRITRQKIREQSAGKKVLNLFAYTGSFSVYAASGGANEVVTVDLSKTYLSWAVRNMQLNGFTGEKKYKFSQADAKKYLKILPENCFDLIIMDPPSFSNSKKMKDFLDIQIDHPELINDCLKALKFGGVLYFSTNLRKFVLNKEKIAASEIKDITKITTPFDFEKKLFRQCYWIRK